MSKQNLSCRMYENQYPEIDDIVMVNVKAIADMGAYVSLLEYNNIEGMVLHSELSRKRIRSIQKFIRVGRNEALVVLRVDKEKGYIDLSKRRVSPEEIQKCEDRYNKSKAVHSVMRYASEKTETSLESLYVKFGWPLYRKYGHAYDAFYLALSDPKSVFADLELDEDVKQQLLTIIEHRFTPQKLKIRADIEVVCFDFMGVDGIKAALHAGKELSTKDIEISIKLVAPPLYVISTVCTDKKLGVDTLTLAIERIKEKIKIHNGDLVVKRAPKAVSESDEHELAELLKRAEIENAEVSGDSDSEED